MAKKSRLKARSGPRVQVQDVPRVISGSPGRFLLTSKPATINAPRAALALAKRHMPLREAHSVVTRLFDHGEAVVELPRVENLMTMVKDLAACHVVAKPY